MVATIVWTQDQSSYYDGRLVILEVPTCNVLREFYLGRNVSVKSIAFSPRGRYIAIAMKHDFHLYDLFSPSKLPTIDLHYTELGLEAGYMGQYVQFNHKGDELLFKVLNTHYFMFRERLVGFTFLRFIESRGLSFGGVRANAGRIGRYRGFNLSG